MKKTTTVSVLAALLVLSIIGASLQQDAREHTPTTFGKTSRGYGALFELLGELGFPVTRSYDPPTHLPARATIWWIAPRSLCEPAENVSPAQRWAGREWLAEGGTALVFLGGIDEVCPSIAGVAVPRREHGGESGAGGPTPQHTVSGDLVNAPRSMPLTDLVVFAAGEPTDAIAGQDAGRTRAAYHGRPLVIEHRVGNGRLVLVSDSAFLRNEWLAQRDAAPLAVDFVRAFGVPRLDERDHGFGIERHPLRYLAASPAASLFAGLVALGALLAWRGNGWPPPALHAEEDAAPALDTFVDSLAALYSATEDHARLFARYRELTLARLRRGLGAGTITDSELMERLRRNPRLDPAAVERLAGGTPVRDRRELRAAVHLLDRLAWEATR